MGNTNDNFSQPVGSSTEEILAQVKAFKQKAKVEAEKRYEAEIAAKLEAQRLEREKQIREEEKARQKAEAEFRMRIEREEHARIEAEVKAQVDREQREKEAADQKRFREMQVQLKIEAERRARAAAEQRLKDEIETRAKIEKEIRHKAETEYRAKVEAEYRAKIAESTRERVRAVEAARAEAERRIIEAAEAKARAEVVEKARREAEMRAKAEQEMRAKITEEIREKAAAEERERIELAMKNEQELLAIAEEQRKIAVDESAKIRLELAHKAAIEQSLLSASAEEDLPSRIDPAFDPVAIFANDNSDDSSDNAPFDPTSVASTEEGQDLEPLNRHLEKEYDVSDEINDDNQSVDSSFLESIRTNADLDSVIRRKKYRIEPDLRKGNVSHTVPETYDDDKYGFREISESFSPGFSVDEDYVDTDASVNGETDEDSADFNLPEDRFSAVFNGVAGATSDKNEVPANTEKPSDYAKGDQPPKSDVVPVVDSTPDSETDFKSESKPDLADILARENVFADDSYNDEPQAQQDDIDVDLSDLDDVDNTAVSDKKTAEIPVTSNGNLASLESDIKAQDSPKSRPEDDPLSAFFNDDNAVIAGGINEDPVFAADAMSPLAKLNLNPDLFRAEEDRPKSEPKSDPIPADLQKQTPKVKKTLKGMSLSGKPKKAVKSPLMDDITEFVHPDDAEEQNVRLKSLNIKCALKTAGTSLLFIITLVLQLSPVLSVTLPNFMNYRSNPSGFLVCNLLLLIAGVAVNGKELLMSAARLVKRNFTFETPALITSVAGILYSLLLFSNTESVSMGQSVLTALPMLSLTVMSLYRLLNFKRTSDSFDFMIHNSGEHAICRIDNETLNQELRTSFHHDPILLGDRKSSFTMDFFRNSFSDGESSELSAKLSIVSLIAMGVIFIASLICGAGFVNSFGSAFAVYSLASPLFFGFGLAIQLFVSNKLHLSSGASVIGADTVKRFETSNCMIVRSSDLFSSVEISGLKFTEDNVDEIIKYTAAATLLARSPLADTFMGMIEDDTKQLPKVDSLLYKDGMGLICTADSKRILIGNRDFMKENNVSVPSKEAEDKVIKGHTVKGRNMVSMVYISLNGKISALFAVSYIPDNAVADQLCDANAEGVNLAIMTSDPNITSGFLENGLGLRPSSVYILPSKLIPQYMEEQEEQAVEAGVIYDGTAEGFATGVAGVKRLYGNLKAIRILQVCLSVFGLVIPSLFLLFGGLSALGFNRIIFMMIIMIVANLIVPTVRRT